MASPILALPDLDLHARTMYVRTLERETGKVVQHRNLRCEPDRFLSTIEPYRDDLAVRVECDSPRNPQPEMKSDARGLGPLSPATLLRSAAWGISALLPPGA